MSPEALCHLNSNLDENDIWMVQKYSISFCSSFHFAYHRLY